MEKELYPLKFHPLFKETLWGGDKLHRVLKKKIPSASTGESWEISCVPGNLSVVSNGFLAGNNLEELIEVYMGDLVGDTVYDRFGLLFPLLVKFIDAREKLSIQVHPDDQTAEKRHGSPGKTEMWYIIDTDPVSELIMGFNTPVTRETYSEHLRNGTLESILRHYQVKPGDTFFIPAGTVHGIGSGILLAEIQQTSDITYRIYDYNRKDKNGKERELHTAQALDVIRFKPDESCFIKTSPEINKTVNLVTCDYFTTNLISFDKPLQKDYYSIDSFVILICIRGSCAIHSSQGTEKVESGDTILLPNTLNEIELHPAGNTALLEIYIF